jgi:hypothetical protein
MLLGAVFNEGCKATPLRTAIDRRVSPLSARKDIEEWSGLLVLPQVRFGGAKPEI